MKVLVVRSLRGGGGGTTVAANLSAALQALDQQVLSLDLNAGNDLRLHFAVDPLEGDGWARRLLTDSDWQEAVFAAQDGARILPLGGLTPDQWRELNTLPRARFDGVSKGLLDGFSPAADWLIVDGPSLESWLPPGPAGLLDTLTQAAALRLLVVSAEPASYASLHLNARLQSELSGQSLLLNRSSPGNALASDLSLAIRQEYAGQLVPIALSQDSAVPEALAGLQGIARYSPTSLAAREFEALAIWCQAVAGAST